MNLYVVVEGDTEKAVYPNWIPLINPSLQYVVHPSLVQANQFCVVSSMGYPMFWDVLDNAIDDVNANMSFDKLVTCIDSDEMDLTEKLAEVNEHLKAKPSRAPVSVVVQHFCFETWALGNRKLVRQHPSSERLKAFKMIHDVRVLDPELLPSLPERRLTRSQFAEVYLRAAFNDRHRNLTYRKGQAAHIAHPKYLDQLKLRLEETGHISSFSAFLASFQ